MYCDIGWGRRPKSLPPYERGTSPFHRKIVRLSLDGRRAKFPGAYERGNIPLLTQIYHYHWKNHLFYDLRSKCIIKRSKRRFISNLVFSSFLGVSLKMRFLHAFPMLSENSSYVVGGCFSFHMVPEIAEQMFLGVPLSEKGRRPIAALHFYFLKDQFSKKLLTYIVIATTWFGAK